MAVEANTIALLSGIVGIISGIFGIGGGFLTTPFLIFLGIPPAVAVATQSSQLVASSATAVVGHWKKRNIDLKMAGVLLIGGVIGTFLGILIFKLLQMLGQVDLTIQILYVLFLCTVGGMMLSESVTTLLKSSNTNFDSAIGNPEKQTRFQKFRENLPYKMSFPESRLQISILIPGMIGIISGLMVSVMGIGAGFLLVPAMIYLLKMPPLLVAGTSLIQIAVTSAIACVLHAVTNQTVDMILAIILISGSVIGAQIGVRLSPFVRGAKGRFILASIIMVVGLKLVSAMLIPPSQLYSIMVQ